MANKMLFLMKNSLKKKMGSKWFVIANTFLLIVIVALINIDSIITFFGGNFDKENNIIVIDNTNEVYNIFDKNIDMLNTNENSEDQFKTNLELSDKNEENIIKSLSKSENEDKIVVIFNKDENNYVSAKIVSMEYIDTIYYQLLTQALIQTKTEYALSKSNIDMVELGKVSSPIAIERVLLDENKNSEEENMSVIMGTVFPTVILPFFMLVIFLIQMIGNEVNEEKTTRSMEVIISNVSPKAHFFSKILAANIFVITQGLLLIIYAALGICLRVFVIGSGSSSVSKTISDLWSSLVASGFADKLGYIIPLTIVLLVLSFLAYSLVAGILASMTTNMEDYQQIQTPIILISLVSYYLSIMASMFDGSIFIRILSYIPFISCLLSPALLAIGQIGLVDIIISIVILIVFNYITIKKGMRIYKAGILNYSTDKIWTKFMRVVKEKDV